MFKREFFALRDSLKVLRDTLPALAEQVGGEATPAPWRERLERNVLPALDFDLPVLLVAICGGGSTGKSTLFNLLAGKKLSQVGFRAGLTSRVLLAGHPSVLSGPQVAEALLHRLPQAPIPWHQAGDTVRPGPPLYATSDDIAPHLLLIDTPDFDTGSEGRLVNRERAEPILRTAEVLVYIFTNTVYNNLSNTRFMAEIVGGIGGRPSVLVYRISRAASDEEALEHCRVVAQKLYNADSAEGFPEPVIGIYRMHESDAVAEGDAEPRLVPLGEITRGRTLTELLADLDVARIKRHVFAADLQAIHQGASAELAQLRAEVRRVALYREALRQTMAQEALTALKAFPANEAIALATRLFFETSPGYIKLLRGTGRMVGAPLRAIQQLGREFARWAEGAPKPPPPPKLEETLGQDLLLAANTLRNRLLDDTLIVRVAGDDSLLDWLRQAQKRGEVAPGMAIETLDDGLYNVHLSVPQIVQRQEPAVRAQDWEAISRTLGNAVHHLVGLPSDIEGELRALVADFRAHMGWFQRVRETFFASLSALPPILGVTYTLLTANPVVGGGILIHLESLFGLNDLWALVSIPASAGLSEQERKQLEQMITPVFRLWLERRLSAMIDLFARTVCQPILSALEGVPAPQDERFAAVEQALQTVGEAL